MRNNRKKLSERAAGTRAEIQRRGINFNRAIPVGCNVVRKHVRIVR